MQQQPAGPAQGYPNQNAVSFGNQQPAGPQQQQQQQDVSTAPKAGGYQQSGPMQQQQLQNTQQGYQNTDTGQYGQNSPAQQGFQGNPALQSQQQQNAQSSASQQSYPGSQSYQPSQSQQYGNQPPPTLNAGPDTQRPSSVDQNAQTGQQSSGQPGGVYVEGGVKKTISNNVDTLDNDNSPSQPAAYGRPVPKGPGVVIHRTSTPPVPAVNSQKAFKGKPQSHSTDGDGGVFKPSAGIPEKPHPHTAYDVRVGEKNKGRGKPGKHPSKSFLNPYEMNDLESQNPSHFLDGFGDQYVPQQNFGQQYNSYDRYPYTQNSGSTHGIGYPGYAADGYYTQGQQRYPQQGSYLDFGYPSSQYDFGDFDPYNTDTDTYPGSHDNYHSGGRLGYHGNLDSVLVL
jgi:hypothetical protein